MAIDISQQATHNSLMSEIDIPTRYLELPEGRLAYDVRGSGPLAVLSPGMGDLRQTYRLLAPALADAGYTVVTVDLRGHGDSDASFAAYGSEPTADDLTALIEHLGGSALLIGNSMSAGSAAIVAARRPELVSGLVLLGPFVRDPKGAAVKGALMRVLMAPLWAARVWGAYLPSLYGGDKPSDFEDYRARTVAAIRRPEYASAFSSTTRTRHGLAESSLASVAVPTLIVMGEKDADFPDPAAEAEWIGAQVGGKVVMVPEAGHYPQSQQPQVTLEAILAFVHDGRDDAARGA